jgi:ParB family transcriptional regulator, chromosome partitioning protein
VPRALLRGPAAFAELRGERQRIERQVAEMPFERPVLIPTDLIEPNPDNPRKHIGEPALNELASNMKAVGQLHPCIVTRLDDSRFQLVAGERRWRAAVRAGLGQVWCVVKPQLSSLDRLRMAISENQMREDFSHADRVAALDALQALEEDAGLRGAARALGISPGWLSRQLSLRRDPVLFPALEAGRLSFAQADEIRRAPAHLRPTLVDRTLKQHLSSIELRATVAAARMDEQQARQRQRERAAGAAELPSLEQVLEGLLALAAVPVRQRPVLLQIREAVDRLLDQPAGGPGRAGPAAAPDEQPLVDRPAAHAA